jgi:hypothetical protein
MKKILLVIAAMWVIVSDAQYYYEDIIGTSEIATRMKAYRDAKVQSMTATGYDTRGAKNADFNEWQEVQNDGRLLKVTNRNGRDVTRQYYSFDDAGQLATLRDSSRQIETITSYSYGQNGRLEQIKVTVKDSLQEFNRNEIRNWQYNQVGKPHRMLRVVNNVDSSIYNLTLDEDGNVGEERLYRITNSADPVYYYYDDMNRLSDIVRFNKRAQKLLPDVMFEYDEQNRVIQRITVVSTIPADYLTWRYLFNDKGLKSKEALFNKTSELQGRIEYSYTFFQ